MKRSILILIIATKGLFSCGQGAKSTPDAVNIKTLDSTGNVQSQKQWTNLSEKYIDTKYEYTDATGARLIIHNSLPKGGLKYTAPDGKQYVYAIFWTRIINETGNPFELTIDFPSDSYELPSSPGNSFKLLLPSELMTSDKEPLFNYGLTRSEPFLNNSIHKLSFLDNGFDKLSSLKRTINSKESSSFYVVTLFDHGVNGTLRTGLSIREQNLFYSINDKEIQCGKINLEKLILQK